MEVVGIVMCMSDFFSLDGFSIGFLKMSYQKVSMLI